MYPPMFFGSPCDFGPRGYHNGPFPHHHLPMGHHHPPMGHHHPPVGHHHSPMGHQHLPMGHHHPPMGHQHHPMAPHSWSMGFDHHLKGPHHHRWEPYHAPRGPHHHQTRSIFSKCPLRDSTGHSKPFGMRHRGPFGMRHPRPFGMDHSGPFSTRHPGPFGMGPPGHFGEWPMHLMAATYKLARLMLHASTDYEWLNNTCSMEGCIDCSDEETFPQSSPTNQQQTSGDESDHDKEQQQQATDSDAENSDLWMNAEEGVWSTEVFIGPYAESEVKVLGEGQDGVKVEASHLHGENVVALMMRRLPPPFKTFYTITHTFSRPFVTITATKNTDGVDAAEHLLKEVNLADETEDF